MNEINVPACELSAFCVACFEKLGLSAGDARLTAENLIFANLRGVDSHGVIRLKIYADRLRVGGFKLTGRPQIVCEQDASAVIDGQHGVGQVAATAAMKLAIDKAAKTGAAVVSVRNSNHFGASAFYALQAVERGMIGFAATNAGPTMAPTGGREGRLGNNAFAVAIPTGSSPPLVLDMATGAVAWGKIFVAQQEKRKILTTWALDKNGVPTDDPNAAAHQGLIQPVGGYKGYGLSLLIDILTGVLSGGGFSTHVRTLYQQIDTPSQVAHTCAALRIDAFMPLDEFHQRVDETIGLMRSCPTAPGVERIFVPGEIEHDMEQRRRVDGIPINLALQTELATLAAELGVKASF
ncbi:MAG TPA: Ldh family oxidoreductase [Methylomirabilota bacterium]|nr:Ldh family oxidoreductase [Methylomirabilota bacterium]